MLMITNWKFNLHRNFLGKKGQIKKLTIKNESLGTTVKFPTKQLSWIEICIRLVKRICGAEKSLNYFRNLHFLLIIHYNKVWSWDPKNFGCVVSKTLNMEHMFQFKSIYITIQSTPKSYVTALCKLITLLAH